MKCAINKANDRTTEGSLTIRHPVQRHSCLDSSVRFVTLAARLIQKYIAISYGQCQSVCMIYDLPGSTVKRCKHARVRRKKHKWTFSLMTKAVGTIEPVASR